MEGRRSKYLVYQWVKTKEGKDICVRCSDRIRHVGKYHWIRKRYRVLNIVGKGVIKCANCGCDKIELLEINHMNGGGTLENNNVGIFICNILGGRRKTDDLNLLCKVCNSLHYLELKHGKLPYKIKWTSISQEKSSHTEAVIHNAHSH